MSPHKVYEASQAPSGLKARPITVFSGCVSVASFLPVAGSQSFTVRSSPPLATIVPLGWKATHSTAPLSPVKAWRTLPVAKSQRKTVCVLLDDARVFPSGLKATALTRDL